jgi:organic radical activating enzyme
VKEINFSIQSEIPVMEYFYTLQGEGFHVGKSAFFIRLAGCSVGCVWCDVKESWEVSSTQLVTIESLVNSVVTSGTSFVVITGGEPAMYNLSYLIEALNQKNIYCAIETSGVYELKGAIDWYCFSPKKFKSPCAEAYEKANELKVVVYHKSDLKWAQEHAEKVNEACLLYIQPEWSKREELIPLVIDFIKQNPSWRLSLQTHKYINIP